VKLIIYLDIPSQTTALLSGYRPF